MRKTVIILFLLLTISSAIGAQTVMVDAAVVDAHVSPLIYGAGTEDVNHEIYGGLYDQRIFGEGFEELAVMSVRNFTAYDNLWSVSGDRVQLAASHGKLISHDAHVRKGSVEAEMRLEGASSIGGFILEVSNAGTGMDTFDGYEVSLDASTGEFVFGKHRQNWQPIARFPVQFGGRGEWNTLRVEVDGATFVCFVNGTQVYEYTDKNSPLSGNLVGLRSVNGSVSFRNFTVDGVSIPFEGEPADLAGFRQYDDIWTLSDDGILSIATTRHGKIVREGVPLTRGELEVEVRIDGSGAIAGFIFNVSSAGNGADAFNGYEVSLNGNSRTFVYGKHRQNWTSITNKGLSFTPSDWNKLRISFDGAQAKCFINDKLVFEYEDKTSTPLVEGLIGLRSYGGPASFRHLKVDGHEVPFRYVPVGLSKMWDAVGDGTYVHDGDRPFTGRYAQCISGRAGDGIANRGLNRWGIGVTEGEPMHNVLYLCGRLPEGASDAGLRARVALQSIDGLKEYASAEIAGVTAEWQRFEADLLPNATYPCARYVLSLADECTLWADQVLLATDSYPFRRDITDAFLAEGLTFLRYGGTMVNAADYLTRHMVGSRLEREPYDGYWYLNATNGFAIPEFVEFARLIGTEPAFAINIEDNPADVLRLLEEIREFHPHLLQIGNEECIGTTARSAYEHYVERFLAFYDAIHPLWPDVEFVIAAWWRPEERSIMEYVFRALDGKAAYWDYHPWTETPSQAAATEKVISQMQQLFLKWNPSTTMRCAIFEENGNTHDMARALAHAVMLNVVRRTDGFVPLDSPANALQPWQQNDNGWDQGQIFFDASHTWMQPPYYAQQMASAHHQPLLVHAEVTGTSLDVTVTRNAAGDTLTIHAVNYSASRRNLALTLSHFGKVQEVKVTSLSGSLSGRNLPENPLQYAPVEQTLELPEPSGEEAGDASGEPFTMTLPLAANSYTVFVLTADTPSAIVYPEEGRNPNDSALNGSPSYDLGGRPADAASRGIYIVRRHLSDGSVQVQKIQI